MEVTKMKYVKRDSAETVEDVVLRNTGLTRDEYFHPDETPYIHHLAEAVAFFKAYIQNHPDADVTVVGDYDADGVNATDIMYFGLRSYLGRPPKTRLPRRFTEGYGLSEKIIDEIPSGMVITVDNGIAAYAAIKNAKEKGLAVIVTDHHLAPRDDQGQRILPPADVIVDPNAEDESAYKDYCGAGLAYRFVLELLGLKSIKKLKILAAIATVADVMPIMATNWKLVRDGIDAYNARVCLPALALLADKLGLGDHMQADDFGFKIGPCYNASGRLYDDGADQVLSVLKIWRPDDDPVLPWKIDKLIKNNDQRKAVVKEAMGRVTLDGTRPIVYLDPELGEGIIGIIAGQLAESNHCPAIVFTRTEKEGVLKGSGRSIAGLHLKDALDKIPRELILGYGGHAGAVGLSIMESNLGAFRDAFREACGEIPPIPEELPYDLEMDVHKLAERLEEQEVFAPFGEANPQPLYHTFLELDMNAYNVVGDGTHFMVKMPEWTACGFGMVEKYESLGKPRRIEAVVKVNTSWYNGNSSYRIELVDFKAA